MIKNGVKGAIVGAGLGTAAGITLHILQNSGNSNNVEEEIKYKYIENNSDVLFHLSELNQFRTKNEMTKTAIESLHDSVDRLLAMESLSERVQKKDLQVSWPVTAQHYATDAEDALRVVKSYLDQNQLVIFNMHTEELKTQIQNSLYNIDMNVQNLMNS